MDMGVRCVGRRSAIDLPELDPLVASIQRYRDALADFSASAPDVSDRRNAALLSYTEPRNVLMAWARPAVSRDGALAALRMAVFADQEGDYQLVGPMIEAALTYIDGEWAVEGAICGTDQ